MGANNPISLVPHKNIFNVFNKGRKYFQIRFALEILLTVTALVGVALLIKSAMTVYPTVIRDYNNKSYSAVSSPYSTSYAEISTLTIDTMRLLFTSRGKKNYLQDLRPFVASNILAAVGNATARSGDNIIRSATVHDFFITETGRSVQAVIYMSLYQTSDSQSVTQPLYFNILLRKGERSPANPAGWSIVGLLRMDEATYLEKRNKFLGEVGGVETSKQVSPETPLNAK